jgi:hypothetical protein
VVVTEDEQEELDACVWDPRWVAAAIGVTSVGTVGWVVGRKRGRRRRSIFLRESDRRPIRQI